MKVKRIEPDEFKPVKIEITLDSEAELRRFHALFNHSILCDWMREVGINPSNIAEAILNDVNYDEHKLLCDLIKTSI